MKALSMTLVMFFGSGAFAQAGSGRATEKPPSSSPVFTIVVDPPRTPIHKGTPINVKITVTNISSQTIWWESDRGPNAVYRAFTVRLTQDGHEAETTYFHRKISGRPHPEDPMEIERTSLFPSSHPPGTMFVTTIDLTRLYDIKQPGAYTLSVSRFDNYSDTIIQATPVTLNIMP